MNKTPILIAGFILGAFAAGGVGLVAVTQALTKERIAANEREATLRTLREIIPHEDVGNDPIEDQIRVSDSDLLGSLTTRVFRVRSKGGRPLALVLDPVVPDGYAGPIKLLVSVLANGSLGGVRVLSDHETPGLGDRIELSKSDWVLDFDGKSLGNPPENKWKVKRDGGVFDQFAGATITPRAVVKAVKRTLIYVRQQGAALYVRPTKSAPMRTKEDSP
jgi:Na+-translocating ferredoxin:NAD+ oxidoreductase subunit G